MPQLAQMHPFRMWVGGVTMYSSIHCHPFSPVNVTPPESTDRKKLEKAFSADSR